MKNPPPLSRAFILDMIRGFVYFSRRASCIVMGVSACLALPVIVAVVALILSLMGIITISIF